MVEHVQHVVVVLDVVEVLERVSVLGVDLLHDGLDDAGREHVGDIEALCESVGDERLADAGRAEHEDDHGRALPVELRDHLVLGDAELVVEPLHGAEDGELQLLLRDLEAVLLDELLLDGLGDLVGVELAHAAQRQHAAYEEAAQDVVVLLEAHLDLDQVVEVVGDGREGEIVHLRELCFK